MNAIEDFLSEARSVPLSAVAEKIGLAVKGKGPEHIGPCPACGGRDRFSINFQKGVWHCRKNGGGGDGIALAAHVFDHNLSTRSGLFAACSDVLGRPVPSEGEHEAEAERDARLARIAQRKADFDRDKQRRAAAEIDYSERAINKARGIYMGASPAASYVLEEYLALRTGATMPRKVLENFRLSARHTYWHGNDEFGPPAEIHCGPAMIAPFVTLDGTITGCHETWIDLNCVPKYRPVLLSGDERLQTKKMQGRKLGSFIPLCGSQESSRWMAGEGIETVLAVAAGEGFREDTFYLATGDLGNLAGKADPASKFPHPRFTKIDSKDRVRPVMIDGPIPKPGCESEAFQVKSHVSEIVLLADGDSEEIFTLSAMARALARLSLPGRVVDIWWPPRGSDFADAFSRIAA